MTVSQLNGVVPNLNAAMIWTEPHPAADGDLHAAFRKEFSLAHTPAHAVVRIFAYTRYQLFLNGRYVLRGPNRFQNQSPEFDTIDVTKDLTAGENAIAVLVHRDEPTGRIMKHLPGLTLVLKVQDGADRTTEIKTGSDWQVIADPSYGPRPDAWGSIPERVDARAIPGDWTRPGFDARAWPSAATVDTRDTTVWPTLGARRIPLQRETPLTLSMPTLPQALGASETLQADAGKIVQAYTVLDLDAEPGSVIELHHTLTPTDSESGMNVYTTRGGMQTYREDDTFAGRYLTIRVISGRVTLHRVQAIERLYPYDVTGKFACSDPMLTHLWGMLARATQLISEDAYVDCADRERVEWMDCNPPSYESARVAMTTLNDDGSHTASDPRLYAEVLRRTALTRQPGGWVKAHTCSERFDIHARMEDRACLWVMGVRKYYAQTGDASLIREVWPSIVSQMHWFLERRTVNGLVSAREWVTWDNPLAYQTCEGTCLNAFVWRALEDASFLGDVIGEKTQAQAYAQDADALAARVNATLWNDQAKTYDSALFSGGDKPELDNRVGHLMQTVTQTPIGELTEPTIHAALFPLWLGIVPPGRKTAVTQWLFDHALSLKPLLPDTHPGPLHTPMSFYYLFSELYRQDTAADDMHVLDLIRTHWRAMEQSPLQSSWEDFHGGSRTHGYSLFPVEYLSSYVLGVRHDGPSTQKQILLEPRLGDLTDASGVVVTALGPVSVSWKTASGKLEFECVLPHGATGTVRLPCPGPATALTVDHAERPMHREGRYVTLTLTGGAHTGTLRFTPDPAQTAPTASAQSAQIRTRAGGGSQAAFEGDRAQDSLIGLGQPSVTAVTGERVSSPGGGTNTDAIRNGTTRNGSGADQTQDDGRTFRGYGEGDTVTFVLDTARHPSGYDLTKILTFAGHPDSRASQHYSVSVALASDSAKFITLISAASVSCDGGSSEITIQDAQGGVLRGNGKFAATGVAAIRFDFHDGSEDEGPGLGFNVYREIQVVGHPHS